MPRGVRNFDPGALRTWRRRRGLTQQELADAMGVKRTYALQWERDRERPDATSPTPAVLARLADVLDVHPGQLTSTDAEQATLVDLRVWAGLSREELARRLELTTSLVGRIERGQRDLDDAHVEPWARELAVSPAAIRAAHQRVRADA